MVQTALPLFYFSFAVWLIQVWLSSSENGSRGSELQNKEQHSSYDLTAKMMVLCNNTLCRRLGSISSMWWNGHPSMTGRQRTKSKSTEPRSEAVVLANEFKGFDTDTLKLSHYEYQIRFLGNFSFCRFQFSIGEPNH